MCCLKPNQRLTSPQLFVAGSWRLRVPRCLWKVGSRLFIQQRIFSKHTRSISLHGYLSGEAEVTVFLKSGRHKSPSAANYYSHPTCWSQRAGGAALRRETCLRSIGCCCSWAPLDGLFKRLHMLVEGGKAAEYINRLSEPLCGPGEE